MLFAFLCFKQLAHIPLDLLWVGAFLNDGERGQRKPCNLSFLESDDFIQPLNLGTISIASRCFVAMPELSAAEKFLADWTSAYTAADRPDRMAADTSGNPASQMRSLQGY
jgi:hypothetical protein